MAFRRASIDAHLGEIEENAEVEVTLVDIGTNLALVAAELLP